jgi:uncharacterized protein (TIGR02271 family)
VVGVFDDYATAQRAARELATEGVPQENVRINSNMRTEGAGYGGAEGSDSDHGGVVGWFKSLFGTDDSSGDSADRDHYAEAVRRGSAVLTVNVPESQAETAVRILNQYGAVDIDRRANAWRGQGYTGYDANAQPYSSEEAVQERDRYRADDTGTAVPVIEEELQVGKRVVQRGGVRVYSRVVEQPVEEEIGLREEHVHVERRAVDRAAREDELGRLKDQTIEVTESVEEPVVSKRARVREEVVVTKDATERTEKIHDNVRRTEVHVDKLDEARNDVSAPKQ